MTDRDTAFAAAAKLTIRGVFNLRHYDAMVCDCCGRTFETKGAYLSNGRVVGLACAVNEVRGVAIESCGYLPTVAELLKSGNVASAAFDTDRRAVVEVSVASADGRDWLVVSGARIASRDAKRGGRWFQSAEEERAAEEALEAAARAYYARRDAERAERDAKRAAGGHIGTVDARGEFTGTVEFHGNIGDRFFPRILTVLTLTDSEGRTGQAVCWGKFPAVEKGQAVRVTATVKSHGEYRGGASTVLIRCKVA